VPGAGHRVAHQPGRHTTRTRLLLEMTTKTATRFAIAAGMSIGETTGVDPGHPSSTVTFQPTAWPLVAASWRTVWATAGEPLRRILVFNYLDRRRGPAGRQYADRAHDPVARVRSKARCAPLRRRGARQTHQVRSPGGARRLSGADGRGRSDPDFYGWQRARPDTRWLHVVVVLVGPGIPAGSFR
jgi:hypothetical protein